MIFEGGQADDFPLGFPDLEQTFSEVSSWLSAPERYASETETERERVFSAYIHQYTQEKKLIEPKPW